MAPPCIHVDLFLKQNQEEKMDLEGKVAIIAGANSGVGKATARRFTEAGAKVVLVGRNLNRLQATAEEAGLKNDRWMGVEADLTKEDGAQTVLKTSLDKFGRADVLFNFVGGWLGGDLISDTPAEKLETMIQNHIWSSFFLVKVFSKHFLQQNWGRVAIVSSPSAEETPAKSSPYSVSRAGEEALIMTLANEVKGTGVTANVIRVRTIDDDHLREKEPSDKNWGWTQPEEIAGMLEYLSTEEGGRANGAIIPLYGEG
jgi:NAD(P)-dependent dehydrogenase (short-subunit alcohol dehydrogenase family)